MIEDYVRDALFLLWLRNALLQWGYMQHDPRPGAVLFADRFWYLPEKQKAPTRKLEPSAQE